MTDRPSREEAPSRTFKTSATPSRSPTSSTEACTISRARKLLPAVPGALPPMPASYPKNRLGLAKWLVDENNPVMARVTVNRFWQEVFGTGFAKTAEDFGSQGEAPSHPELLDWLAVEFRESGWDVKKLFKLMVMSSTYRQSARVHAGEARKGSR